MFNRKFTRNALWKKKSFPTEAASVKSDTAPEADDAPSAPGGFKGSYDDELARLRAELSERGGFAYDPSADPRYSRYVEQYTAAGRRAMEDTAARSAALTGGYGSSYAASAAQQDYDAYMHRLADVLPELYADAYERYTAEGKALQARYEAVKDAAEDEYARYKDERDYSAKRESEEAQLRQRETENRRSELEKLISSGYVPGEEELAAAGMTREQAYALLYEYYRKNKLKIPDWLEGAMAGRAPVLNTTKDGGMRP